MYEHILFYYAILLGIYLASSPTLTLYMLIECNKIFDIVMKISYKNSAVDLKGGILYILVLLLKKQSLNYLSFRWENNSQFEISK
jgi:hypothetical protein